MLDGAHAGVAAAERGRERASTTTSLERAGISTGSREVGAHEDDARVRARRMQRQLHRLSAVQPDPGARDLLRDRALVHRASPLDPQRWRTRLTREPSPRRLEQAACRRGPLRRSVLISSIEFQLVTSSMPDRHGSAGRLPRPQDRDVAVTRVTRIVTQHERHVRRLRDGMARTSARISRADWIALARDPCAGSARRSPRAAAGRSGSSSRGSGGGVWTWWYGRLPSVKGSRPVASSKIVTPSE